MHEGVEYLCTWQCCPSVRGTLWTSASLQGWCPLAVIVDTVDCSQLPADGAETIKQEIEDNSTCKSTTKSSLIFCIFFSLSRVSNIMNNTLQCGFYPSLKWESNPLQVSILWFVSKVTGITNVLVNNHKNTSEMCKYTVTSLTNIFMSSIRGTVS